MEEKNNKFLKYLIIFLILFILMICFILLYSHYIGTKGLNIKEYNIKNGAFMNELYGLKIAHISDIHYGRTIHEKELEDLVIKINKTKPDIVVLTGDLIDKDTKLTSEEEEKITSILNSMEVTIGKYAIKGEHDLTYQNWDILMENSHFKSIDGNYQLIYLNSMDYILLAGSNSSNEKDFQKSLEETINYIETAQQKPNYSILLIHEPDLIDTIDYKNFNLILAGHSHNGQIRLPFIGAIIKPKKAKKYYDSYYKINSTELYISGGIGVSNINFRLFNRPSFNLYRLIH